jgi:hypothetical protein
LICLVGDQHRDFISFNEYNFLKTDYVIGLGDFGLIWDKSEHEKQLIEQFERKHFTTLFLDGNHDNISLLNEYPIQNWNGGKVHYISDSVYHLMRGQVYTFDNKTIFVMGGADSIDKSHRKEGIDWWKEEIPSEQEINEAMDNLDKYNWKVDIVLTHTAAPKIIKPYCKYPIEDNRLYRFFNILEENLKYKHWFFGHFHKDVIIDEMHTMVYENVINLLKREIKTKYKNKIIM